VRVFVASTDLRPMALQLLQSRTPAAYAGVEKYAQSHAGQDVASLAWFVLGYAHLLDQQGAAAIPYLQKARPQAGELADYVDLYLARAHSEAGDSKSAISTLYGFEEKYSTSILRRDAALEEAAALLASQQPARALELLKTHRTPPRADMELAIGRASVELQDTAAAIDAFRRVYFTMPISAEASAAESELHALARNQPLVPAGRELRQERARALLDAHHAAEAVPEYRSLLADAPREEQPAATLGLANALWLSGHAHEASDLLRKMPDPGGELAAQRLYYLVELSRSDPRTAGDYLSQLRASAPQSPWLAEALLTAANIYLLRDDDGTASRFYAELAGRFPSGPHGPYANWKAGWLQFRMGDVENAKQAFERQIALFPTSAEASSALYWRGRMAEEEKQPGRARAYYLATAQNYGNDYYSELSRRRLHDIGIGPVAPADRDPLLEQLQRKQLSLHFSVDPSPDSVRYQKSLLLENCGMIDLAARELQAANASWSAPQIARLFNDAGEYNRALRTLKQAAPGYFTASLDNLPREIWEGLFPRPYWEALNRYASENGLDPFLVASLIRQESEFNAAAISRANAIGLMQLLPSVGRKMAREAKVPRYNTAMLLEPSTNVELGTRYLRQLLEKYNGTVEYALAAYNAGADRVDSWRNHHYRDIQEFVEDIPFTETRDYVQAVLRNQQMYQQLYPAP